MNSLFIIGNGFDIAHGLKTKYHHFRDFLVQIEKEECINAGEISISEDYSLLHDDKIEYHFKKTGIPAMLNILSETLDLTKLEDISTGMTALERMDEITQFLNDAHKIVQWIKHGSGQYYISEKDESQAIKRFIAALEPETNLISHNTNLNTTSAYWQTIEGEFGVFAVKFLQSGSGSDNTPLWLTLRLFIKLIDVVEGENWTDLEKTMGTNDFKTILNLFNDLKSDDIYETCITNFITSLYYNVFALLHVWIIFTEIVYEKSINNVVSELRPRIKRNLSNFELSLTMKCTRKKNILGYIRSLITNRHPMAKKQLIDLFNRANNNYFLSFNYTKTLENIYNIPKSNICHIHGVSKDTNNMDDSESGDLIFGHGRESIGANVVDVISTSYNITKKPVNQCIINNQLFFEKLTDINNIYTYGFSFGDVDMPYIEKICQSIRNTTDVRWYFNSFGIDTTRTSYEEKIRKAGFNGSFDIFHID